MKTIISYFIHQRFSFFDLIFVGLSFILFQSGLFWIALIIIFSGSFISTILQEKYND